jgi:hypothetical protein
MDPSNNHARLASMWSMNALWSLVIAATLSACCRGGQAMPGSILLSGKGYWTAAVDGAGESIVLLEGAGRVVAAISATGAIRWQRATGAVTANGGDATYAVGRGARGVNVTAWAAASGEVRWSRTLASAGAAKVWVAADRGAVSVATTDVDATGRPVVLLARLTSAGDLAWAARIPADGELVSVAVGADGALWLLARGQATDWVARIAADGASATRRDFDTRSTLGTIAARPGGAAIVTGESVIWLDDTVAVTRSVTAIHGRVAGVAVSRSGDVWVASLNERTTPIVVARYRDAGDASTITYAASSDAGYSSWTSGYGPAAIGVLDSGDVRLLLASSDDAILLALDGDAMVRTTDCLASTRTAVTPAPLVVASHATALALEPPGFGALDEAAPAITEMSLVGAEPFACPKTCVN